MSDCSGWAGEQSKTFDVRDTVKFISKKVKEVGFNYALVLVASRFVVRLNSVLVHFMTMNRISNRHHTCLISIPTRKSLCIIVLKNKNRNVGTSTVARNSHLIVNHGEG